jgi:hypothetical protein
MDVSGQRQNPNTVNSAFARIPLAWKCYLYKRIVMVWVQVRPMDPWVSLPSFYSLWLGNGAR